MDRIQGTEPQPQQAMLVIEGLSKVYTGRHNARMIALDTLNLTIPKGQIFGFLGANGAGKTTTIKMICGLIFPTSGTITVNGYSVAHQHSMAMRQIGAVLEGTRNVYWRLSAWENLMYFGHLKGCSGKELKLRAEYLLRELDLWDRRHDSLRVFSRGMQQKVAIACALIADPPLVLLDEPTLGLDIQSARTVKEWIFRLAREQNKTVILTTHQLDMAQALCDRVAIIRKGHVLADKALSELLNIFRQEYYQIKVAGSVDAQWQHCFEGMSIAQENEETILTGPIADQGKLLDYLNKLHSLHYPLLSTTQIEPNLEDVFMQLIAESEKGDHRENDLARHR
ncbi:daunorubicin resistance protein DrrA family ABC transporter ATP-binding protein [Dictyobacter alpinus]|uniref:Daunorubicin resistance protein DrrA family ABC transporter ATP-binding protein n=1 Tax=Dictyobacter alpinus TaxID=2014873 RepID=A0A402BJ45_9CHLR|nr:ABC transporter ATP-binding protein [Dictyobacter alpinus]GCE31297.1 daunorubicin resistance protein DrrA family ABC transporter ATP-binding protein [Dictyobacter alpinus]